MKGQGVPELAVAPDCLWSWGDNEVVAGLQLSCHTRDLRSVPSCFLPVHLKIQIRSMRPSPLRHQTATLTTTVHKTCLKNLETPYITLTASPGGSKHFLSTVSLREHAYVFINIKCAPVHALLRSAPAPHTRVPGHSPLPAEVSVQRTEHTQPLFSPKASSSKGLAEKHRKGVGGDRS